MKLNSDFFSMLLIISSLLLVISTEVLAEKEEKPERWFEVEVILFKQLNNKDALKEQFPDNITANNLPEYKQSFDLLTPYLQPDLTRIKQFAPLCGGKDEQHQFLDSLQSISAPFPEQMALIEQVAMFYMPDFSADMIIAEESAGEESAAIDESNIDDDNNADISEQVTSQETEQAAVDIFTLDFQEEALAKAIFSTQNICIISESEIEALFDNEKLTHFSLDSFEVDHIPNKLNASGAHSRDKPYLIADDSLLLQDISQRLGWSKEFRPLLHFGWRQVGITKSKAIPLKLFAGEHLEYQYQQALTAYRAKVQAQDTVQMSENIIRLAVDENNIVPVDNELKLKLKIKHKQQALNDLFSRIDDMSDNPLDSDTINASIKHIEKQNLEDIIATNDVATAKKEPLSALSIAPKEPLQSWFLEGFLKVHLDHYLYITADFNVFNKNQVLRQDKKGAHGNKANDFKLVNFSQTRRVISGEIHYFDHPYIGMIIQIRRFDPSKPKDEAVTQAIK